MGVPMMVKISVVMHVIAIKRLMWAHGEHETSTRRVIIYAFAARSTQQFRPTARVCGLDAKLRVGISF